MAISPLEEAIIRFSILTQGNAMALNQLNLVEGKTHRERLMNQVLICLKGRTSRDVEKQQRVLGRLAAEIASVRATEIASGAR